MTDHEHDQQPVPLSERDPVEQFAGLPLMTQRALMRLAYGVIDATSDEKAQVRASVEVVCTVAAERSPAFERNLRNLDSLVGAVETHIAGQQLGRVMGGGRG